ncbi:unnamed protein product [Fraxinus pennsylvanica]|uniref:AP2/ERF domain-containing protein n=1 Tax=Fraxinus pennsylvanica TaxID=56036 RepID=A0AAD2E5Q9_9LAMI|nr:unnamed protein product [Fraxinus pennsylvanica]
MNDDNDKCLGFSLSTHMKMEAPAAVCYGGFHSPFSVMPLKSDGSRCIMKPLSTSHTQAPNSSPKLEDFLGAATVETHQYGSHETGIMVRSLDSMFYNQEPFKEQIGEDVQVQQQQQQQQYYSAAGLQYHGMYETTDEQQTHKESQLLDCNTLVPPMSEDAMTCSKTWVDHHALEHLVNPRMIGGGGGGGAMESLSLSMSPGSQSSCVTASRQISPTETEGLEMENRKRGHEKVTLKPKVHRKAIDSFGQRTSQYRGVTRHRWTGRYEAHLWDNSCKKEGQTRKGRQVYLGGYDMEEKAARAYDLAAIKYWGPSTHINFPLENYENEVVQMENMSRQEFVAHLRRRSSGFSRGISMYRGVTRHHQHGRWQARIGRVAGNKDLYLGTFSTQEEAAEAYDIAAIKFRGVNAVTNFEISRYDVEKINSSDTLPARELARQNKETDPYRTAAPENEEFHPVERVGNVTNWKMVQNASVESLGDKMMYNAGNYQNSSFSGALQDLIGIESTNPHTRNFTSPLSLVIGSRETIPDKTGGTVFFAHPTSATNYINSSTNVNSWIPTSQLRPVPLAMSDLPVFPSWNDS